MSNSDSHPKPSASPDFSSLADQVEEPTQPWQIATRAEETESNAGLAYTIDQNYKTVRAISQRGEMKDYCLHGMLSLIGGLVFTYAFLVAFPAGAMISTGFIGYGICLLYLAYSSSTKLPTLQASAMTANEVLTIRPEVPADEAAIRALHVHVFAQEAEAKLVDELRAEGFVTLSLVAVAGVRVIGHVLFSPLEIVSGTEIVQALALAPVGVVPGWQRQGIGSALIREGLSQAARGGERIVIVLGEPGYYRRFGFRPELTAALESPYAGEYFMALELSPGALEGVSGEVRYAAPFERLE
jgi:putative acetyltransferase